MIEEIEFLKKQSLKAYELSRRALKTGTTTGRYFCSNKNFRDKSKNWFDFKAIDFLVSYDIILIYTSDI